MAIYANNAGVRIIDSLTNPHTVDTTFWAQASDGTDYSGEVIDMTLNPGEESVEVKNVYGSQKVKESRPDMVTVDFTMELADIDILKFSMATAETAPSGYERYSGTENTGNKTTKAIVFHAYVPTVGTINALLNEAYITSKGEISLNADDEAEQTFSAACLVENFHAEYG